MLQNQTWEFRSSSNPRIKYEVQLRASDGRVSCDCKGWTILRGSHRECKHTKEVIRQLIANGQTIQVVGDAQHVIEKDQSIHHPNVLTDISLRYIQDMETTVANLAEDEKAYSDYIAPMLAASMPKGMTIEDYSAKEWVMQEKYDGVRVTFRIKDGQVKAWSRPRAGTSIGKVRVLHPNIVKTLLNVIPEGYYDGELVVTAQGSRSSDVAALENSELLKLIIFDVLEVHGDTYLDSDFGYRHDVLLDIQLESGLGPDNVVGFAPIFPPSQAKIEAIVAAGGEGVVLKKLHDSDYQPGYRSPDWIKIKQKLEDVFEITGFESGLSGTFSVLVMERVSDRKHCKAKTLNNDWLRRCAAGEIDKGTLVEVEYQVEMEGGFRHPMVKRVVGEE